MALPFRTRGYNIDVTYTHSVTIQPDYSKAYSHFIDFALGHVDNDEGIKIMEYYLYHGTQIQRNYCALYFGRRGEYLIIRKAYDEGLIDAKQAFSR